MDTNIQLPPYFPPPIQDQSPSPILDIATEPDLGLSLPEVAGDISGLRVILIGPKSDGVEYPAVEGILNSLPAKIGIGLTYARFGFESLAVEYLRKRNIPVKEFKIQWKVEGKQDNDAGCRANVEMLSEADAVVAAFYDSKPNKMIDNLIGHAKSRGIPVYGYNIRPLQKVIEKYPLWARSKRLI